MDKVLISCQLEMFGVELFYTTLRSVGVFFMHSLFSFLVFILLIHMSPHLC